MQIKQLKEMEVSELVKLATEMDLEGAGSLPYRELLYALCHAP